MKNIIYSILFSCLLIFVSTSCSTNSYSNPQTSAGAVTTGRGDCNLDLQSLNQLIDNYSSSLQPGQKFNPKDIELQINQPDGINNVSLDGDGQINYVKVSEFNTDGKTGLSFDAITKNGDVNVATTFINPATKTIQIVGNQDYYGYNNQYQSTLTSLILFNYFLYPHPYYYSPYHYGYYHSGYHRYGYVSRSSYYNRPYVSRARVSTRYTPVSRTISTPNGNKPNPNYNTNRSLSNQTNFQKGFYKRDASKPVNNSGFSRSSSSSRSSYTPSRSSSSRSSGFSRSSSSRSSGFSSSRSSSGRRR